MDRRTALTGLGLTLAASTSARAASEASTTAPLKTADPKGCVALVTGSNTGIGLGFVKVLLARGAKRIYATARRPETLKDVIALDPKRVVGLELDITNDAQRKAAADKARDVTWLINNAGISGAEKAEDRRFLAAGSLDDAHKVMNTNFWSQVEMIRAFAPIIVGNGNGAIVQILSVGALYSVPDYCTYSASKFAASAMIAGVRAELDRQRVLVSGVFTGGVNTRMTAADYKGGVSPEQHANEVIDAMAAGETDILAGGGAKAYLARLRADPKAFEREHIERFYARQASAPPPG
jgi:NAD(P)-dependent dehydrogenase (short-subunit alcohol dehydrogenase family)